jgi:hypothetical protein
VSVAYDAAVLIAADRNDRAVWAEHRVRLEHGLLPVTTAPVVSQVSRSPRQVQLRRFLRGCRVAAFAATQAHEVGALLGTAGSADVVDGHLVAVAAEAAATVLTGDVDDLNRLSVCLEDPIPVVQV